MWRFPSGHDLRRLAAVIAVAALPACETIEDTYDTVSILWDKPIILPCPDYRILAEAARRVEFAKGAGRDLVDINSEGVIGDVHLECITRIDKETRVGVMEVAVTVAFGAKRGPANRSRKALLPYFVSVTDAKRNVLYREEFKVAVDFPGNQTALQFLGEQLKLELPLNKKVRSTDYIIFTGFMLTREQLDRNRRLKGRDRI